MKRREIEEAMRGAGMMRGADLAVGVAVYTLILVALYFGWQWFVG